MDARKVCRNCKKAKTRYEYSEPQWTNKKKKGLGPICEMCKQVVSQATGQYGTKGGVEVMTSTQVVSQVPTTEPTVRPYTELSEQEITDQLLQLDLPIEKVTKPQLRDWIRAKHKLKFLEETNDNSTRDITPGDWVTVHPIRGVIKHAKEEAVLLCKLRHDEFVFRFKAPAVISRQRTVQSAKELGDSFCQNVTVHYRTQVGSPQASCQLLIQVQQLHNC